VRRSGAESGTAADAFEHARARCDKEKREAGGLARCRVGAGEGAEREGPGCGAA
jgi:hypothetical protein